MTSQVFDIDIHQTFKDQSALYPFLEKRFVKRIKTNGLGYPASVYHSPVHYKRLDAKPPSGTAGSDLPFLKNQLFDEYGVSAGILNGSGVLSISYIPEIEYPLHLARAYNSYLIEEWLNKDKAFYGSLQLALQDPIGCAEMIREFGTHERIVQAIVPAGTPLSFSHPSYRPILEAIQDVDIALAFHIWQPSFLTPPATPIGNPYLYSEWKTLSGMPLMAHLVNLIFNGVFEEFPKLRCVFLEGGYSWLIYLLNRMEQMYKSFRKEASWLKESPMHYVMKHCRFGTQPLEEIEIGDAKEVANALKASDLLMFSSDYPHWDADNPSQVKKCIPVEDLDKILFSNAIDFYKLN